MSKRNNKVSPALKHGVYSGMNLLPGEDREAFEKLHRDLIAEFSPVGPMEKDIVATMARLLWRKQNLRTYRLGALAKNRYSAIKAKYGPSYDFPVLSEDQRTPEQIRADEKVAEEEIRNELGDVMALVEMGEAVTIEQLFEELALIDRIDGMLDRCDKRLLMVRGIKSMPSTAITESASRKRLTAV